MMQVRHVIVDLLAVYVSGVLQPGDDAPEARWVTPGELEELPVNQTTLEVLQEVISFRS